MTKGRLARWSAGGGQIYFFRSGNVWAVSLNDRTEREVTSLRGRPGRILYNFEVTNDPSVYFNWSEDQGDIWVMDVVQDEGSDD